MTKDDALKHHADKYGLTVDQFRMMCESASGMYEGQGMNSLDYALAREAYFAGFTKACKEALAQPAQEPECSNHPDAPHGFCRDASHSAGRYVCECEGCEEKNHEAT